MGVFSKRKDFTIPDGGISEVRKIKIGGVDQYLLIQGYQKNKPVLLLLHGGPSMPNPGVSSKGTDYTFATKVKELVKHFVVVFWDQRGTGKSYSDSISLETMNIEQFVSDTSELTNYLTSTFQQEKIFLVGYSWGTIIGLELAARFPEKYHSYTGISQIVNWCKNDKLSLKWTKSEAVKRGKYKALKRLERIGDPPLTDNVKQWLELRRWQFRFGAHIYKDENVKPPNIFQVAWDMIKSKDYKYKDIFHVFFKGPKLSYHQRMIEEFAEVDFTESAKNLKLPVTFIHGKKDVLIHGELLEEYFNMVKTAHEKRIIWLENSAHIFHPKDAEMIEQYLIEELGHLKYR